MASIEKRSVGDLIHLNYWYVQRLTPRRVCKVRVPITEGNPRNRERKLPFFFQQNASLGTSVANFSQLYIARAFYTTTPLN